MISFRPVSCITSFAFLVRTTSPLVGQDKLKVAIGQMETWVNQAPVLGQETGIFKKHDIELENFATQGSGETLAGGCFECGTGGGRRRNTRRVCAPISEALRSRSSVQVLRG